MKRFLLGSIVFVVLFMGCGGGGSDTSTDTGSPSDLNCVPQCSGKDCGDDGCGGSCGFCSLGQTCNPITGLCVGGFDVIGPPTDTWPDSELLITDAVEETGPEICVPQCQGKQCGNDGCGNACGECSGATPYCNDGVCVHECAAESPVVDGWVNNNVSDIDFTGELVDVQLFHKLDIDEWEDGCISKYVISMSKLGLGCEFSIQMETDKDGHLSVTSAVLMADSFCPGWSDSDEGEYQLKSSTLVVCSNVEVTAYMVESTCIPSVTVGFSGLLTLERTGDGKVLEVDLSELQVVGDMISTGDTELTCPSDPCAGKQCGEDECGASCGTCQPDQTCGPSWTCLDNYCPVPVVIIEEGEEVPPQTTIHLHGDQSQLSPGVIPSYYWTVEQPEANKFNLVPSQTFPNPTHEINVTGTYTYCLDVCDAQFCSNDVQCNTTACKKVVVMPEPAIHCELTWDTPGDSDQFDEGTNMGSDMDIHFTHPFATGPDLDDNGKPDGWFDLTYDCFWYNPNPEWESMNPNVSDDPSLDRNDTDGAGPENINLEVPVDGREYWIGVHYWDDHGFGASYPMIRCWILGQLAFEKNLKELDFKMFKCDMWEVATIQWNSGKITPIQDESGGPKITHCYQNPSFAQIGGDTCDCI